MNETICAISTGLSKSAINIVRMSGDDAIKIASSVFVGKNLEKQKTHTIHYGHIVDGNDTIDEVLVSIYRAPKTYTKEDMVEINTHGGSYIATKILELLIKKGARLAENGEFTKRAFLNGRIDLSQAESVMDVISAGTKNSLKLAYRGLTGEVSNLISSLRKEIEKLLLQITVNIDYPEYVDEVQVSVDMCKETCSSLSTKIKTIIEKAENQRIYKEGIKTIIVGKPNVGKSSLLNSLINEEKAIVTDISGTTRDIVEGELNIGGIVLHLIDTAGIRETDDIVEKIGINKSLEKLDEAELVLLVLDHSRGINEEDNKLIELTNNKNRIIIANKADINKKTIDGIDYIDVSAVTKEGFSLLENKIKELFIKGDFDSDNELAISSTRHISILKKVLSSIESAYNGAELGMFIDMIMIDLKDAYDNLGLITGETASDELINELFKNFCLGK